jgi:hypothetical protein
LLKADFFYYYDYYYLAKYNWNIGEAREKNLYS